MVDGDIQEGTECSVRCVYAGRRRSFAGDPGAVCGLCGVAKEVDRRGDIAATGGVLEKSTGGGSGAAGVAGGSCAASAAGLCRRHGWAGAGGEAGDGAEGAESAAGNDIVHDVAGGVGSAAGTVVRTGRSGNRNASGEPGTSGDRGTDRVLREYADVAGGCIGVADSRGLTGTGEGTGAGSAAESG